MALERADICGLLHLEHSAIGARRFTQGGASSRAGDARVCLRAGDGRHLLLLVRDAESARAHLHFESQRRAVDAAYRLSFPETLPWPHRQPRSSLGADDLRRQFLYQNTAHDNPASAS